MNFVQTLQKEATLFLLGYYWRFSAGKRKTVILMVVLSSLARVTALLTPLIFAAFLNEIQASSITEENFTKLVWIISSLIPLGLVFWLFHATSRVIERTHAFKVREAYQDYLIDGVLNLDLEWHSARDSGDTIDKVYKASQGLFDFSQRIYRIIAITFSLVGTCIALTFFSPYIGIAVFAYTVMTWFVIYKFDSVLVPQYRKLNEFANVVSAKIFDAFSNISSVIILHIQKNIHTSILKSIRAPFELFKSNVVVNEVKWFASSTMFDVVVVIPIIFYVYGLYKNNLVIEVGTISALYIYLQNMSTAFFSFGDLYSDILQRKAQVDNAKEVEESYVVNQDRQKVHVSKNFELKNMTFAYADEVTDMRQINDVSLKFTAGEKVALIGRSGSGKTTFLKLLHGLYTGVDGTVQSDGGDVHKVDNAALVTMLVPQEPELFSSSIRENITFGLDIDENEVLDACSMAQFGEVIEELPQGLESKINEKGVNLSGGQKQRLALARALLFAQDKEIILLDESTSSVDPENEVKIYQNVFKVFSEKTIIATIHKMNLLKYFDRIIMFDKGEVVDGGTFDELMNSNKQFKNMWEEYIKSNH